MGWAKYCEDNVSIYIGRMALKENFPMYHDFRQDTPVTVKPATPLIANRGYERVNRPKNQNGRRGLEITFISLPEKKLVTKLRMNGWWWSSGNGCWCNLDTVGNRKYAQDLILKTGARLAMVNE